MSEINLDDDDDDNKLWCQSQTPADMHLSDL